MSAGWIITFSAFGVISFYLCVQIARYMKPEPPKEPDISAQELKDLMAAKELETLRSWNKKK